MLHVISQLDGFSLLIILVNRLLQQHMTVLRSTTSVFDQAASTLCSSEHHRILYKSTVTWRLMEEDGRFVSNML